MDSDTRTAIGLFAIMMLVIFAAAYGYVSISYVAPKPAAIKIFIDENMTQSIEGNTLHISQLFEYLNRTVFIKNTGDNTEYISFQYSVIPIDRANDVDVQSIQSFPIKVAAGSTECVSIMVSIRNDVGNTSVDVTFTPTYESPVSNKSSGLSFKLMNDGVTGGTAEKGKSLARIEQYDWTPIIAVAIIIIGIIIGLNVLVRLKRHA